MLAIGADEIGGPIGDTIKCSQCGESHKVEYANEVLKDGTKVPSKKLAFYNCGTSSYLAGIDGRLIKQGRGE